MKQANRHKKIIELVNQLGYVSTEQLVAELNVSPQTIRRDLNEMAENNLIRRHHGGQPLLPIRRIVITPTASNFSHTRKMRLPNRWQN